MDNKTLAQWDRDHWWHPFTQMQAWCDADNDRDPLIIARGKGVWLFDQEGNSYIDGNSSIWTNIHGHSHPVINQAIADQLEKISHCSALGFSNEPAIHLAQKLGTLFPHRSLPRVFFSDDGSTAVECACKMALQYRQQNGEPERIRFLSFSGAYHGDTAGAASLGGIGTFHERFASMGFDVTLLSDLQDLSELDPKIITHTTALIIEPLIQGAAGMRLWPQGMLAKIQEWCKQHDVFLILDEVMTGFGRTGTLFACEQEGVIPDFLCLAKGLTGGALPLAATLTTDRVYRGFLGTMEEQRTFYYGHSYCGNPLACAAALANLEIFSSHEIIDSLPDKIQYFQETLHQNFGGHPAIKNIRMLGLIAGLEFHDFIGDGTTGVELCYAARKFGLLTRPILQTVVLMPPLSIELDEIDKMIQSLLQALDSLQNISQSG